MLREWYTKMHLKVTVPFVLFDHMRSKISKKKKKININIIYGKIRKSFVWNKSCNVQVYTKTRKNIKLLFLYFYLAFLLIPKVYFKSYVIDTTRRRQKVTTEINLDFLFLMLGVKRKIKKNTPKNIWKTAKILLVISINMPCIS